MLQNQKNNSYDFIIAGAGPVGCILAMNLYHHGFRVLILEKNDWHSVNGPYLNGISEVFFPLLHKLRVDSLVKETQINEGKRLSITTETGTALHEEWEERGRRIFFCREEFDVKLRHGIADMDVDCLDHVQAVAPLWKNQRVIGIQCVHQEKKLQFFCKQVIVCDGSQSKLAKTLGFRSERPSFNRLYQGRMYANTQFTGHHTALFLQPRRGQILLTFSADERGEGCAYVELETDLNHPSVKVTSHKDNLENLFQQILSRSENFADAMKGASPIDDWRIVSLRGNYSTQLQSPGVVLMGDAARCMDPIGSSGLLMGLQGIDDLLKVLIRRHEEQWDFAQWEQDYLKRVHELDRFIKLMRFFLKRPGLLEHVIVLLNQKPAHRKTFLSVFNGLQNYEEFLHWQYQLKFWSSAVFA
ncbi:MAG: FAD-dependent monooxygenase [SAR324 cluster bacterium]|nr:FAD-dependent monooxygenase [SAR324 cluster bacterium]